MLGASDRREAFQRAGNATALHRAIGKAAARSALDFLIVGERTAALAFCALGLATAASAQTTLSLHMTWGAQAARVSDYRVRFEGAKGLQVGDPSPEGLEAGETIGASKAGAGDTDSALVELHIPRYDRTRLQDVHIIWSDLIQAADPDTAQRLAHDGAMVPHAPELTVTLDEAGLHGFSVTVEQLLRERAIWIPDLHVFLSVGHDPPTLESHLASLAAFAGRTTREQTRSAPEADYKTFASLWPDMGGPSYVNPQQRGPGHIVALSWDSSVRKFGVDRGGGVWGDYGNPDRLESRFNFGDISQGLEGWKSQRLVDGLPIVQTNFERAGVGYELEQFAYPLNGPPLERRGDIDMVLYQKVTLRNLGRQARTVQVGMDHLRALPREASKAFGADQEPGLLAVWEEAHRGTLFTVQGDIRDSWWNGVNDYQDRLERVDVGVLVDLAPGESKDLIVKLASPAVPPERRDLLVNKAYAAARQETVGFWEDWLSRGTQIEVPDPAVNELFRANLWHALRLPRRHGGEGPNVSIDLPYSNFAYSQTGTPWPINQAVYVDYMLYALRGYNGVAAEELLAQFRNNQEQSGRVNGFAHWLTYSPGMLYSVGKFYLLSHDSQAFEGLLPPSLAAMAWCLDQIQQAEAGSGLVEGPLNDLTADGYWAFNQAYMYAGLKTFGQALEKAGKPEAGRALAAAERLLESIERGFRNASVHSPIVQLRDHTWVPYVPTEAKTFHRLLDVWYPTDIDTGPLHLARLEALPPNGDLTDWMLDDHEDNLFYKGLGAANEPVYNQQCTAYLLRDEPESAIRCFYTDMAAAFSRTTFEPVEHRWTHGQYFGPPSTDGSWFELYRNLLVRETGDGGLVIGQAIPRKWLEDGQKIEVRNAPTYFGPFAMTIQSKAAQGEIDADVQLGRDKPSEITIRLRHPQSKRLRSVRVNGKDWRDFDPDKEWIRLPKPTASRYEIQAMY